MPQDWFKTRIENRVGEGVPDVFVCAKSLPFWIELKITKTNRINISSGQIAWNYSYSQSGGVSFFLVNLPLNTNLYLFEGRLGRELKDNGLATTGSGTVVPCLWSGSDWSGLFGAMYNFAASRVGVHESGVGSGRDQKKLGPGVRNVGQEMSSEELMERLHGR